MIFCGFITLPNKSNIIKIFSNWYKIFFKRYTNFIFLINNLFVLVKNCFTLSSLSLFRDCGGVLTREHVVNITREQWLGIAVITASFSIEHSFLNLRSCPWILSKKIKKILLRQGNKLPMHQITTVTHSKNITNWIKVKN